ncbi:hypothetical protein RHMOL_Rhmol04G0140900 [Rhododendron molle]|uniref:Uncharacterized protein n=1 Tax=Rhododendron molle TaxID=49168 RepID=A0ACC0P095_RHOML|nr:hypothetical protein RHMOL_Rhmol04G0140900 [Rhododendron molle]
MSPISFRREISELSIDIVFHVQSEENYNSDKRVCHGALQVNKYYRIFDLSSDTFLYYVPREVEVNYAANYAGRSWHMILSDGWEPCIVNRCIVVANEPTNEAFCPVLLPCKLESL